MAAAYVRAHLEEYAVVAWVRAQDGGIEDLALLVAELGLDGPELTPSELAARAIAWLEACETPWLLVLDNVAGPAELDAVCPKAGRGAGAGDVEVPRPGGVRRGLARRGL